METIPFLSLTWQHNEIQPEVHDALLRVYARNHFILGEEVESFEREYAMYSAVSYCIGVGNGLDALSLALQSLGIREGDEVIVPAHTYIATWHAVSRAGGRIVPVEPETNTFNIDASRIEQAISSNTKAILPVHLYGQACDMTAIMELAQKHKIAVVEDNAQAHGARWLEKMTGSFGTVNATSFYPTKNLGALGDGGAITAFDEQIALFLSRNRNYGFARKNFGTDKGSNSRLDEIQAAVLRIKLRHLDVWNEARRKLADVYLEALRSVGDLILPLSAKEAYHVYHQFVIRTDSRDSLKAFLLSHGVETMIHYPIPPHLQPAYSDLNFKEGAFPLTERIAETALSLPLWPGMERHQVNRVIDLIQKFFK